MATNTRFVEGASEACTRNKDNAQWYSGYDVKGVDVSMCTASHLAWQWSHQTRLLL